jgi:heterodisulfide reductase subunit D
MSSYEAYLDGVGRDAMDRCTSCGKCVEVCPTAAEIGLDRTASVRIVEELKAVTSG